MRLKNKVVLITGAGSGIGKESALLFAKEGAKVIINDINEEAGEKVDDEIRKIGGKSIFIPANITNELAVQQLVRKSITSFKKIDVLFNNAGISGVGILHENDFETWKKVIDVNINGVFLVSKHVVPYMIERQSGSIINMSSCIAKIGLANRASYAATKGAVLALTKSMQVDYAKDNIRVNALLPGTIFTPFVEDYISKDSNPEEAIKVVKNRQLGGELGQTMDVAYAALYLASDESKFMMGTPFIIDGGIVNGK